MRNKKFFTSFAMKQSNEKIIAKVSNFKILIFSLTLVSVLSYLVVINRTNTMGYEIAEMQLRIKSLKEQYRDLENQATELTSLPRIKEISSTALNMVAVENFNYIFPAKSAVAVKE